MNLPKAGYLQRCDPPLPAQPLPSLSRTGRSEGRGWDRAHAGSGPLATGAPPPLAGGALGTLARPALRDVPRPGAP